MRYKAGLLLVCLVLSACQTVDTAPGGGSSGAAASSDQSNAGPRAVPTGKAIAFVDGKPVTFDELRAPLLETAGGTLLFELTLDRKINERLGRRGITLPTSSIDAERAITLAELSDNADEAQRLLSEIRRRNRIGDQRFARQLRRNAALRVLVQDEVELNDGAVRREYDVQYGPRYEARMIVVDGLDEAARIVREARGGTAFSDLAVRHSVDASSLQGGYLGAISPLDSRLSDALRQSLPTLAVGSVSDPIHTDTGYAILKVERKIEGGAVAFDDVKNDLTRQVRRRLERLRMQQLARSLMADADVVVLDPVLNTAWQRQQSR